MEYTHHQHKNTQIILIFLLGFLGVGAIGGGCTMPVNICTNQKNRFKAR
jgi:hypothetical protein